MPPAYRRPEPPPLPDSVQEIADVIGRAALRLVGALPRWRGGSPGHESTRVILYVPRKLRPDHRLVQIIGYPAALRLVQAFGGEILYPANCNHWAKYLRDARVIELFEAGASVRFICAVMGLPPSTVDYILDRRPSPRPGRAG